MDGALIANEMINLRLKEKKSGIIVKLDLEKAFDRLNWAYLDEILLAMGFGAKWRSGFSNVFLQFLFQYLSMDPLLENQEF